MDSLAAAMEAVIERINAIVGEGTAEGRNEESTKGDRTDVGFAGASGGDRAVVPTTRERIEATISLRSVARTRSGLGTAAVLRRQEKAMRALLAYVPPTAEDMILGETGPVSIEFGNTEIASVETAYLLRIELRV